MRVAIDIRRAGDFGIGTYIRNVVPRIIASRPTWRFTLFAPRNNEPVAEWTRPGTATIVRCISPIYSIAEQAELPLRTPRNADLFWSPHYNVPLLSRLPLVVTVHDVAHLALAEMYGRGLRKVYAYRMFSAVRARASEIMFDSAFTEREFARLVGAPASASTIHLGVDGSWSSPVGDPSPHPHPYILFVGSVKPHKNLIGLLRAFESLQTRIAHDLVIVGAYAGQRTHDGPAIELGARLGDRVAFVDGVDDETLKRYVAGATALVLPSFYEGFGLPALEAMAAGCPCVVSSAASLPEVCGDAALYCDPNSPSDIAAQIYRLVGDDGLRIKLIAAGRERAAQFDWDVTAARAAAVLERGMS